MNLTDLQPGEAFRYTDKGFDDGYIRITEGIRIGPSDLKRMDYVTITRIKHYKPASGKDEEHVKFDVNNIERPCRFDNMVLIEKP